MAQYSATRKEFYPPTNSDLHEVMMLGTQQTALELMFTLVWTEKRSQDNAKF